MFKNKSGDDNNGWGMKFQEQLIEFLSWTKNVFYNFILYVAQLNCFLPDRFESYHLTKVS